MLILTNSYKPFTWTIFVILLQAYTMRAEDDKSEVISNCFIRDYSNLHCNSDFNMSDILIEQRRINSDPNTTFWSQREFRGLELFNLSIEAIDQNTLQFHGFKFETILIENAPRLKYIHPEALVELKEHLTDFRAINTSLPQYDDFGNDQRKNESPFKDFLQLREVYIGEQSHCPLDETLLYPCKSKFGALPRKVPSGLFGWTSGTSVTFATTTHITCNNENLTGDELKEIFVKVSKSDHLPKHFDVLSLRNSNVTEIPSDVFSNVSITTIWMSDVSTLKLIKSDAFNNGASDRVPRSIQVLDITNANFTAASSEEVDGIFHAFSSLTNIRVLRLSECGVPHIPPFALAPKDPEKQLNNLRYLTLSFDRRKHLTGIKSVGSYAFSGAPNLVALGLIKNYIEQFDSFAFAFNQTSTRRLAIHIGGNPFNDTYGLKPNAFSGSKRPVQIKFEIDSFQASDVANNPSLHFMPEDVFRTFIEENPKNYFEVDYFNVNIWCDCRSQWMFEKTGKLMPSVQNGLRIKRVEDNLIGSEPLSIQCKTESSFECLPNCLTFPLAGLIHCGGNKEYDVNSTFYQLALLNEANSFEKMVFSSKEIRELPKDAFGSIRFNNIDLADCWNLSYIHPNAFGASTASVKTLSMKNTNLTYYPNFANFPNLETIKLDDFNTYHINSSNFDFTHVNIYPKAINIFMNNGRIDQKTFTKLNNATTVNLIIGERNFCSTIGCFIKCKPITLEFEETTVTNFLEANPNNKIQTNCYFECSCKLEWMYRNWKNDSMKVGSRVTIWLQEYFGVEFYCVPQGSNLETTENFFGVDISQFNYGRYFKENCSG